MTEKVNANPFSKDHIKDVFFGSDAAGIVCLVEDLLASGNVAKITMAARIAEQTAHNRTLPAKKIVFLSTFTLKTIEPHIRLRAFADGYEVSCRWVEYDHWWEALSEGEGIVQDSPDLIVWIAHPEDLVANLDHAPILPGGHTPDEETKYSLGILRSALSSFRSKFATAVAISTVPETWGPRLLYNNGAGLARKAVIDRLNEGIADIASSTANTHIFDYSATVSDFGRRRWFNPVNDHQYRTAVSVDALPFLSEDLWRFASSMIRPRRKVLALDLDNTLWGGIVGECGPNGVAVRGDYPGNAYREFQKFIKNLKDTGVALALISRNNERDAREAFELNTDMPLSWDDFAAHRVNWGNKADNLFEIAAELNLGIDSFVFVDDNPVECELVQKMLPDVIVVHADGPPSHFPELVVKTRAFDTVTLTDDDRARADSYDAERRRKEFSARKDSVEDFLAELNLELTIRPPEANELARVAQLFAKTNQFNITAVRHSLADVMAMQEQDDVLLVIASVRDKFGDYGITSVLELRKKSTDILSIDSFLISCRVLGRNVEKAIAAWVENYARSENFAELHGLYIKTKKNDLVENFYIGCGFENIGNGTYGRLLTGAPLEAPGYISINSHGILDNERIAK